MKNETKNLLIGGAVGILIGAAGLFIFYQSSLRDSSRVIAGMERENEELAKRLSFIRTEVDSVSGRIGELSDEAGDIAGGIDSTSDEIGFVIGGLGRGIEILGELIDSFGRIEVYIGDGTITGPER